MFGAVPVHNFNALKGTVVQIEVRSPGLAENALGDPSIRSVAVYLPAGYPQGDVHYPLFVDLASFTSSGLKRLAWQSFGESVPQRLERLIEAGEMGPVIVAFPDSFTSWAAINM